MLVIFGSIGQITLDLIIDEYHEVRQDIVGAYLSNKTISHLYASPMRRARQKDQK